MMKKKNRNLNKKVVGIRKFLYIMCILTSCTLVEYYGPSTITSNAEQAGSSPDTGGAQSIMVKTYNTLVSKGTTYGSASSPDWTYDWGTYWNRIMYSASWEPDGTATTSDVLSGKTFYSGLNNRTIQTGTASSFGVDYSVQQYIRYTDVVSEAYEGEESTWTNTNALSGSEVWYDTRTGLYWARSEPSALTNSFTISTCDFFDTGSYPTRGEYGTSGTDPDCGNAINACATLSLPSTQGETADTDWYLPSQKELLESYQNGIYNQAGSTFTTTTNFWTSTEWSGSSSYVWRTNLSNGITYDLNTKGSSINVRCVRRD